MIHALLYVMMHFSTSPCGKDINKAEFSLLALTRDHFWGWTEEGRRGGSSYRQHGCLL